MSILVTDYPTIGYHRGYEIKEIPAGVGDLNVDALVLWDNKTQLHQDWIKGIVPNQFDAAADVLDYRIAQLRARS